MCPLTEKKFYTVEALFFSFFTVATEWLIWWELIASTNLSIFAWEESLQEVDQLDCGFLSHKLAPVYLVGHSFTALLF